MAKRAVFCALFYWIISVFNLLKQSIFHKKQSEICFAEKKTECTLQNMENLYE